MQGQWEIGQGGKEDLVMVIGQGGARDKEQEAMSKV